MTPEDHKITDHAVQRLAERLNCTHPIRHVNKVRRDGSFLGQSDSGYTLRRSIDGDPTKPVNYHFTPDGWLKTVVPVGWKGFKQGGTTV